MASKVLTNAYLSVNGVNLSSFVRSITLNWKAELQDNTAMSATSRSRLPGLKDWDLDVEFFQDYVSGGPDATLFSLIGASPFAVEVRSDAGAVSTTNPKYTGSAVLESYEPAAGSVGEMQMARAKFTGTTVLTRATA